MKVIKLKHVLIWLQNSTSKTFEFLRIQIYCPEILNSQSNFSRSETISNDFSDRTVIYFI